MINGGILVPLPALPLRSHAFSKLFVFFQSEFATEKGRLPTLCILAQECVTGFRGDPLDSEYERKARGNTEPSARDFACSDTDDSQEDLDHIPGLKKRTRKAFGIRKKEKDTDSTLKSPTSTAGDWPESEPESSIPTSAKQPSPHEPPYHSKAECAREGGKKASQKKELSVLNCVLPTKGKHFYSSSESEEEEESHKKFNIKIKPLQSKDVLKNAATVDELKASIGNIALSPSPVVSGVLVLSFGEVGGEPGPATGATGLLCSSRGPSPLTMGAQDTLPVAAAFTETVNAYFKGADPSKCIVKITGEMVLSFPAGITRHFANNPSPAALTFRVINSSSDNTQNDANTKEFWVNMPNLMTHLKKVSEQKPQATYYNVDMLKYQVSAQGIQSTPLNLAVNWRCEPASTDLRIDYKYNTDAMTTAVALNNVQFLVPIDGGVTKLQAVLPPAVWNAEQQRILWKIPDISQKSENGGVGSLLARFQLSEGPSKPSPLVVQFTSEGSTLSGCDIELVGAGYRFSLIKKRFAAGNWEIDVDAYFGNQQAMWWWPSSLTYHRATLHASSVSTVSHVDEPSPRDEASRLTVRMENTYQLGVLLTC
ncbi:SH3-containing GRB2-like protein 3-interacting protein 1 [Microtus ochrogaster]|uniref:SH3-containing GRB2-like protein 3-interacting protein 1 n=1 Tax=Microtus ochrogaster TaxID=79684 RepID=A0A8J6L6I6_MICOH|nr:SH3-containing GRB2-like protein 3-interacting protein 1 [Microtus ochrogaster]